MSRILFLLIPVLMPLVPVAGFQLFPQARRRRRLIMGGLLLTALYAALSANLYGSYAAGPVFFGVQFGLSNHPITSLFMLLISLLVCVGGIFGFEVLSGGERQYYPWYLAVLSALLGSCCAGNLLFLLACWLAAVLAALQLLRRLPGYKPVLLGSAGCGLLLAAGTILTAAKGFGLTFGAAQNGGGTCLGALLLVLGFGLHAVICQMVPATAPTTVLLAVGFAAADLLAVMRVLYELYGAAALEGCFVHTHLPLLFLLGAVALGAASLRSRLLTARLGCLAAAQSLCVLFGLCLLQYSAFVGAVLLCVFSAITMTALLLCACAFRYAQGKLLVSQLEGIGRQMPIALFCFGCGAMALVGLPPFAGSSPRWYLAEGAMNALPWGIACAALLLVLAGITGIALLAPLSRGFFPGMDYEPDTKMHYGPAIGVPLLLLTAVLLALGLLPGPLLQLIQAAAGQFI